MGSLSYTSGLDDKPCQGVTIGAEHNVDYYQYTYTDIAKTAIEDLNRVLLPLVDEEREKINGSGAEAGKLPSLGLNYNAPTGQPIWEFNYLDTFNPAPPSILPLNEIHDVADPGDAPVNKYIIKTEFTPVERFDGKEPGDAPQIEDVIIPDAPEPADLTSPILYPLLIKPIESVNIPDFTGSLPSTAGISLPNTGDFNWSEQDYDSAILQATETSIANLLAGGVGIPDYVWDAIWNRGRDKIIREGRRAKEEVNKEYASRGFSLPQGAQTARVDEITRSGQEQISETARELIIQQAQHEIENLKYAIAQGQSLENMIGGWYQDSLNRTLDAAKYAYQIQIELFNAQINLFNAEVNLFNAEVTKYKALIEAELSKLEEQKLYLESQRIIGELNLQQITIYEANIKVYEAEINAYNGLVKGLLGKAENNKIKMEGYKAEVQAFGELVNAKTAEYQGLSAEVQAEQSKIGIFETEVKAYSESVKAYDSKIEATYKPMNIRQLNNENEFKEFDSIIQKQNSIVSNKIAEIEAASREFDAKLKSFNVDMENEKTRINVELDEYRVAAELANQETQVNIASANNYTNAAMSNIDLTNTASEMLSRAYSQLASSAMGVVNVSAGISDSTSNSSACRTNYSVSV